MLPSLNERLCIILIADNPALDRFVVFYHPIFLLDKVCEDLQVLRSLRIFGLDKFVPLLEHLDSLLEIKGPSFGIVSFGVGLMVRLITFSGS